MFDVSPADKESKSDSEMPVQMFFDIQGNKPIDPSMFKNWVEGSKYKTVAEILTRLQNDLLVACMARAKFTTSLQSSKDLALMDISSDPSSVSKKVITALMEFDLPYFENADFDSIVKARQNEAAFAEFRTAMDRAFKEIQELRSSDQFQNRVNEIYSDLLITPIANIDRQMAILKRNLFLDVALLFGSLAATFVPQGNALITAVALYGVTKAVEMYKQDKAEEDKIKQLPSFFYWEMIKKKR